MLRVYVCSKVKPHLEWWRAARVLLRPLGVEIISTWLDWSFNESETKPTGSHWALHWEKCIEETKSADVIVWLAEKDRRQCGSLLELGAALTNPNVQCLIVSDYWWSVSHHKNCRVVKDLASAFEVLISMVAGMKARDEALRRLRGNGGGELIAADVRLASPQPNAPLS